MMSSGRPTDATAEIDDKSGAFVRTDSTFRHMISKEDAAEKGRYALIVSHACPWANRCTAMRLLKGLDDCIELYVVHPTWGKTKPDVSESEDAHCGWQFATGAMSNSKGFGSFQARDCTDAPSFGEGRFVRDLYPDDVSKYTVPILYDKLNNSIVNNESSEVLRLLNSEFASHAKGKFAEFDFYPEALRPEIDAVNEWIYHDINNGVYKAGFAKSQDAYEAAYDALFKSLDRVEEILSSSRYLVKGAFTEADIRLFMTLARFDEVYAVYFKTNQKFLNQYPHIRGYCRDVYQSFDGIIGQSIYMDHIKIHYFTSHPALNPYAVIPKGPGAEEDFKKAYEERKALP